MSAQPRLYLHIGLQKTGTSYLQQILWASPDALEAQGVSMVPDTKLAMFRLMLDVRDRYNPETDPASVAHALERFPEQLAAAHPVALVSQEALANATPAQIERLLAHCGDREVHVVITLRDVGRQIPSAWQQTLQDGGSQTLERYVQRLRESDGTGKRIWTTMDVSRVLDNWGAQVPAERIHLVTAPPSDAPRHLLLERFCSIIGVDHQTLTIDETSRANRGLRAEHAEVLRRVNAGLPEEFKRRSIYGDIGKRYFAVQVMGGSDGTPIRLDASMFDWCTSVAQTYVDHIVETGCQVVGDLDDLLPQRTNFSDEPFRIKERDVAALATSALSDVLAHMMEQRRVSAQQSAPAAPPPLVGLRQRLGTRLRALRRG